LADFHFFPRFLSPARHTRCRSLRERPTPHLARAMVLLDASAIARNVGRDLVFPASRRSACSHSDFVICMPRILRFHTRARSHTRFWGRKQVTQSPYPPRSLVRDGQTHPHRPRLVVSHSTCPPLSSSPHAHSFVIGPAVIKHTHTTIRNKTHTHNTLKANRYCTR
jgi:hypothetical protein